MVLILPNAPPAARTPWLPSQGSWLGEAETERLYQICDCRLSPTAPSFLSQEKRWGRKECLDAFGAFCL